MGILLYVAVAALYAAFAWRRDLNRHAILLPVILHGALLYGSISTPAGWDLGLANSLSAVAWMTAVTYWLSAFWYSLDTVKRGIGFLAALGALVPLVVSSHAPVPASGLLAFKAHLVIALLAYGLFTIAALQALVMTFAERRLHGHEMTPLELPPLLTMETLLFRIIAAGFLLLTLTLVSGMMFSEELFGRPLSFTHKVVFAVVSWIIFGILLAGRFVYGWRGKAALRWVLIGFGALILAYLGSKFVLEILLGR